MKKILFVFLTLATIMGIFSFALSPLTVTAEEDIAELINDNLEDIGDVYGSDDVDPGTFSRTIARIIQVALGFMGMIFLALMIYAGFTWMTAAGNEEKISKAKKIMAAAVIGAAIVLSAYAITAFVLSELIEATGSRT